MTETRWQEGARRVLEQVSPSQIESFERCARVWFFNSILRVPKTTTRAQARGTAIHGEVEHLLTTGETRPAWFDFDDKTGKSQVVHIVDKPDGGDWEDLRPRVEVLIPHLPDRTLPTTSMEQWVPRFAFYEGGPVINGRYDMWENTRPRAKLKDVKSSGDFRYCKSPADLADNIQLTSYALPLVYANPENLPEDVELTHLYTRTKGKALAQPVSVVVTVDEMKARWRRTGETVKKMVAWAEWAFQQVGEPLIERVPPTTSACGAYGGCEHRARCGFENNDGPGFRHSTTKREEGETVKPEDILAKMKSNLDKLQKPMPVDPRTPPAIPGEAPPVVQASAPPAPPAEPIRVATTKGAGQIWHKGEAGGFVMKPPATEAEYAAVAAHREKDEAGQAEKEKDEAARAARTAGVTSSDEQVAGALGMFRSGALKVDPSDQSSVLAGTTRLEEVQLTAEIRRARDIYLAEVRAVRPPDAGAPIDPPRVEPPAVPEAAAEDKPKKSRQKSDPDARMEQLKRDLAERDGYISELEKQNAHVEQLKRDIAERDGLISDMSKEITAQERLNNDLKTKLLKQDAGLPADALPSFTLYIDCTPSKGDLTEVVDGEEWVAPIAAAVAQEKGVSDWRMIPYTAEGDLVAKIVQVIAAGDVLPREMRLCGSSRLRAALLEVLVPRATQVVRGVH